jgi:hypothetical protein
MDPCWPSRKRRKSGVSDPYSLNPNLDPALAEFGSNPVPDLEFLTRNCFDQKPSYCICLFKPLQRTFRLFEHEIS